MKTTFVVNAIKILIEARNRKYGPDSCQLEVKDTTRSWSDRTILKVSGFEASAYFAQMKPFLEPMVCSVDIVNDREVELVMSNHDT
tara:strand:+ start:1864 stop:2121 length:258 start_codon:yes stop_codon:yes gene_type:complete